MKLSSLIFRKWQPALVLTLVLAGLLGAAPPPSASPAARRDYRIRLVDPNDKEDPNARRFFFVNEFSVWSEDGVLDGRPVRVLKREEKTAKGDRLNWEFTVNPADQKLLQVRRKVISRQNKVLEESAEYYYNHFFRYPARTIHVQMLPFAAERLDLTIGKRTDIYVAFNTEMDPWLVFLTPEAEETVTVPAGNFRCVRIKVEYSTDNLPGFFRILPSFLLKQIMSGFSMWVTREAPHYMVKFQGKLEGVGSPERVEELVKVR